MTPELILGVQLKMNKDSDFRVFSHETHVYKFSFRFHQAFPHFESDVAIRNPQKLGVKIAELSKTLDLWMRITNEWQLRWKSSE